MSALVLATQEEARLLAGPRDQNLRLVRERFGVDIVIRGLEVKVTGDDEGSRQAASRLLGVLLGRARSVGSLSPAEVEALLVDEVRDPGQVASGDGPGSLEGFRLRTPGQRRYVSKIQGNDLVLAIGPAGTGKTFLAVLMAVQALKAGQVQRIVLCRPAVEAGEHLGFLPGDFLAKVNPYMRPLYDALYTVLDYETIKKYQEREVVEIAPLAYMRGRTLDKAFIILDEAQNTTTSQMKMFLTRMGEHSKIVVTGDVTQIDLPQGTPSGLVQAERILKGVRGIAIIKLTAKDIVRHELVSRIISAYDRQSGRRRSKGS